LGVPRFSAPARSSPPPAPAAPPRTASGGLPRESAPTGTKHLPWRENPLRHARPPPQRVKSGTRDAPENFALLQARSPTAGRCSWSRAGVARMRRRLRGWRSARRASMPEPMTAGLPSATRVSAARIRPRDHHRIRIPTTRRSDIPIWAGQRLWL